jgi:hypothetical protein
MDALTLLLSGVTGSSVHTFVSHNWTHVLTGSVVTSRFVGF